MLAGWFSPSRTGPGRTMPAKFQIHLKRSRWEIMEVLSPGPLRTIQFYERNMLHWENNVGGEDEKAGLQHVAAHFNASNTYVVV
jgi:hypothetical protein